MRLLLAGSQTWTDRKFIWDILDSNFNESGGSMTLVHGHCPNGADKHGDDWAIHMQKLGFDVTIERHEANWRPNGKLDLSAGFRRNAETVALGADRCVVFIHNNSNGSRHTERLAKKAGIETITFTKETPVMVKHKRVYDEVKFEDARMIWRNFRGEKDDLNEEGKRNFAIPLDEELALELLEMGWNVKGREKENDEGVTETLYHIKVTVKMDSGNPPRVFMITKNPEGELKRTQLDESTVMLLDFARFSKVDFTISPYNWDFKGKQGVTAYLKNLYAWLEQDELEEKYAHIPIEENGVKELENVIDVEGEWTEDGPLEIEA